MRAAPPVAIEAVPTAALRALRSLLCAAAAASLVVWGAQHLGFFGAAGWLGAAAGLVAAALGWRRPVTVRAHLGWTGAEWELSLPAAGADAPRHAVPEVALDLGRWMLLRVCRPGAPPIWVEATEGCAGASWAAWRAAVYSSASSFSRRSPEEQPPT